VAGLVNDGAAGLKDDGWAVSGGGSPDVDAKAGAELLSSQSAFMNTLSITPRCSPSSFTDAGAGANSSLETGSFAIVAFWDPCLRGGLCLGAVLLGGVTVADVAADDSLESVASSTVALYRPCLCGGMYLATGSSGAVTDTFGGVTGSFVDRTGVDATAAPEADEPLYPVAMAFLVLAIPRRPGGSCGCCSTADADGVAAAV
jgi:hypothetical protein